MKKIRLSFLCMCLCVGTLALSSCGNDDEDDNKSFTVTFDTDGGSEVESQTIEKGNSATQPEDQTKNDYYFDGWYNNGKLYNFKTPVTSNLTLVAKWEEYEYVDLGLPSGTLWATCNVGAENPWDCGDYFAWGETKTKEVYGRETYIFQESPSTLDADHDAATANWGSEWRMPTQAEFQELKDNCQWEWVEDYNGKGINGYVVYHNDPNTRLFFPAAGYYCDMYDRGDVCSAVSHQGHYWSSSVYNDHTAYQLHLRSDGVHPNYMYHRDDGVTVRPVLCR
jgi:uncharacterized protein (TIGR02145 family)